jgi:Right handed beta helix region
MIHARMWVGALVVVGLLGVLALSGNLERDVGVAGADSAVKKVECDKGQTLTDALKKAKPGDTLQVTGTCHERVTITTDRLTLDGGGSAVLDGDGGSPTELFEAVLIIDGVQGVTLMGFTIQNGPSLGILGVGGAAFVVKDTTLQNNGAAGIFLNNNSSAELIDVEVKDTGGIGIPVQNNSTAVFKGHVSVTGSGSNGIAIQSGSTLEIRGASVDASHNGGGGVDIVDSQAIIFGYPESQGSMLTAHNNGAEGIFVATGSLSVFGGAFAGTGSLATVSASNHGGSGIAIGLDGAVVSPVGAAKFMIENNQKIGLEVGEGGSALIIGGLTVQSNQIGGLLADGAGTLTLVSQTSNPSSIENNTGTDVDLRFGTRVTFGGVTIGSITCDATVLSRGTTVCP